jgi:DNA repair exonuclease SbcCD ATPase subunit
MRRHRKKFGEFLEWMQQNYPKQAEKFERWQKQLHGAARGGHLPPGVGTYMRIFEASKDSPKLAELLKQDLQLKKQRTKLLRKIKRATGDDERNELVTELKEVIGARYDLLVSRKQLEYEQLRARLEELRKKVEESQAEVVKWKDPDYKSKNVQSRADDLVGGIEKFKWE